MVDVLDCLNESQKRTVTTTQGPVLVVAGPGTGKTLTIVRRIAYLIEQGVKPEHILAVTFTNRAAREMQSRLPALPGHEARGIFIGTFHLLGLRILQDHHAGEFSLVNREEQLEIVKPLVNGSAKQARQAVERISRMKNAPGGVLHHAVEGSDGGDRDFGAVCEAYQSALRRRSAFDFDDLIVTPIAMLMNPDIARSYQDRFHYIIVDEYQDINPAQYRLLRLLLNDARNICAVGDSDQAIYAFRGADIGNFLNFEKDFPHATRITLSDNYRSSGAVVDASSSVIKQNVQRIDKTLSAVRERGNAVNVLSAPDDKTEAETIIREIEARMGGTSHDQMRRNEAVRDYAGCSYRFSDFAVIYRTAAQARALEDAFSASGIPYQVIGRRSAARSRELDETVAYLQSLIQRDGADAPQDADPRESKLLTAADYFDSRADAVALMTMHMAKGLEFRVVFIAGCEDGLLPCTIMKDGVDREEERRLFYVGMTRAKDELFLLHCRKRFLYGRRLAPAPSPFLSELPPELIERSAIADRKNSAEARNKQLGLF